MGNSPLFNGKDHLNLNAFEALSEAVIITDLEQRVQYINSVACQTLGVDRNATVETQLRDLPGGNGLMTPEQAEKYRQSLINALKVYATTENFKVSMPQPYEQMWSHKVTDDRILEYRSAPIWSKDQREVIGILIRVKDVTYTQTAEQVLNTMFNEMVTPLAFIKGYAEIVLLQTQGGPNDEQRKMIQTIIEKAEYLSQLRKDAVEVMCKQRK